MEKDKLKKNHYHRRNSTSYGKFMSLGMKALQKPKEIFLLDR